ncbi:hypothetical protein XACLG97_10320002 [Xanthomonas citri pv. citri]|nr:hypothetical protein XACLG97_10320002 [Xanthomonas citri pv. citri]CEH38913.1 hypothetical protein XACG102_10340002 [Xanthomonas citri pv. citri]
MQFSNWLNYALLLTFYGVIMAPRNEELAALYELLEEMTLAEDKMSTPRKLDPAIIRGLRAH